MDPALLRLFGGLLACIAAYIFERRVIRRRATVAGRERENLPLPTLHRYTPLKLSQGADRVGQVEQLLADFESAAAHHSAWLLRHRIEESPIRRAALFDVCTESMRDVERFRAQLLTELMKK